MRVRCGDSAGCWRGVLVEEGGERSLAKAESRSSWFFSGRNCAMLRRRGSRFWGGDGDVESIMEVTGQGG